MTNNMEQFIHIHKTFEKVIYQDRKINNREFDGCTFLNCDFSNSDFSYNVFIDCVFIDCNMGNMQLAASSLKTVTFTNCKLLGIEFGKCEDFLFNVSFDNCILDYASFANKKMAKTKFLNNSMRDVIFTGTNLSEAVFDNSNLEGAVFTDSILKKAVFTTAHNYKIDPEANDIRLARFSNEGLSGLLYKYDIKIV